MNEPTDFSVLLNPSKSHSVLYTTSQLNLYQRLIQYFTAVAECGGEYLDLINFNRSLFPMVLSLAQTETLFKPEHGYACPDGSVEMGHLIRTYEAARAARFLRRFDSSTGLKIDFEKIAVGIGAGTTGVVNCLVPAIRDYYISQNARKAKTFVLTVPLYSVYDGIVREHSLQPHYLSTRSEAKFLPTPEEVAEVLETRPMGLILTFPTNPAQTTYDRLRWNDLKRIAALCQETETFLVVDNVYQDTLWNEGELNPEIFSMLDSADFVLKVFGPSKDRPGFSGSRIGYYCGDPRIRESFFYYSSIQYNTPNSSSRCLFALDLLFRLLRVRDESFQKEHLELLDTCLAGWDRSLNRAELFDRINSENMFERYCAALAQVETLQRDSNHFLRDIARGLDAFTEIINDDIGNVLLVKVNKNWFPGTCHELFLYLLKHARLGILPANAFGFPILAGDAWFRFTTIHDPQAHIATQLYRVNDAVRKWSLLS